jgi:hypothetical protein
MHDGRYKLTRNELFDLAADPAEKTDLKAAHPEVAGAMREKFEAWLADVTRGRRFEPAVVEIGRADENPVELLPSWATVSGTQLTWASPGGTPGKPEAIPGTRGATCSASSRAVNYASRPATARVSVVTERSQEMMALNRIWLEWITA